MRLRVGPKGELISDDHEPGDRVDVFLRGAARDKYPLVRRERHPVDYWDAYSMQHQVFNLSGTDPEHVADVLREAADWIERQDIVPADLCLHQGFGPDDSTELSVIYG